MEMESNVSHIRNAELQVKNPRLLQIVCSNLGLPFQFAEPGKKLPVKIFSTTVEADASFQLKGWKFPCAVNFESGDLSCDNYGGQWGNEKELHQFQQRYAVEGAREHYATTERMRCESSVELENGIVALTMVD